jgi:carbon storage regulator
MSGLILSRREGETIQIGDDITIIFLEQRGQKRTRVQIIAPAKVPVHRGEVYEEIKSKDPRKPTPSGLVR